VSKLLHKIVTGTRDQGNMALFWFMGYSSIPVMSSDCVQNRMDAVCMFFLMHSDSADTYG